MTDLLEIGEVYTPLTLIILLLTCLKLADKLALSYRTVKQLNDLINNHLPGRPPFQHKELIIGGEHLEFHCWDILECIRSLYGDPQFAQDLVFVPERHYTGPDRTCCIYSEMHTGNWWWKAQVCN